MSLLSATATTPSRVLAVPTRTLVLSSVQADGNLLAAPLFDLAQLVGHSDKAMRDCLARLVKQGLLMSVNGRGRSATYRATTAGQSLLDADLGWTAFAHRVDAGLEPWDHQWRLVSFEIPEKQRGGRDALRSLLVELGAAPLHSGLYLHAYDLTDFVNQLANSLGVAQHVASFTTGQITIDTTFNNAELVARVFSVDELAERYGTVEKRLNRIAESDKGNGNELAAEMFAAILETEAVFRDDPLLPAELLPRDWAGTSARRAFVAAHQVTAQRSVLFRESQMMRNFSTEIDVALTETSLGFWSRWFPRLLESYKARLPPGATTNQGQP